MLPTRQPKQRDADGYIPFAERFKAWWHGDGPTKIRTSDGVEAVQPDDIVISGSDGQVRASRWPPERIELVQRLWGEGSLHPGGAGYALELARPFNLQPAMTVLDLSAGLGAGTRAISEEYGVWITAMEGDPDLTTQAEDYCKRKGAGKVQVTQYQSEHLGLPTAKYNCILVRDQLCFLPARKRALTEISKAMKPGGQVILTDFVGGKRPEETAVLSEWTGRNGMTEPLWSPKAYRNNLEELGLDVRIFQDNTDEIHKMILGGWAQFVEHLSREQLTRSFVDTMILEAEHWNLTVRAIEAEELRHLRIHAMSKLEIV